MDTNNAQIVRRNVNIDFAPERADGWSRHSREFENCLNALSFVFPAGERYFINSVRNYMDKITDPVLKEQAERFIFQEAMHSKEHARSNRVLKQVHSYGSEMERLSESMLGFSRRFMPKSTQLATSCGIEHFTAIFADYMLRNQVRVIAESDPAFAALWLWHAAEETEHKAVCFDVYQHVCGRGVISYLHRVIVMAVNSLIFAGVMGAGFSIIKWKQRKRRSDKAADGRPDDAAGTPTLAVLFRSVSLRLYFDYYRFSFHPWNHANAHLVERWKQTYAGFGEAAPASTNTTTA